MGPSLSGHLPLKRTVFHSFPCFVTWRLVWFLWLVRTVGSHMYLIALSPEDVNWISEPNTISRLFLFNALAKYLYLEVFNIPITGFDMWLSTTVDLEIFVFHVLIFCVKMFSLSRVPTKKFWRHSMFTGLLIWTKIHMPRKRYDEQLAAFVATTQLLANYSHVRIL